MLRAVEDVNQEWIDQGTICEIREFVRGVFAGISASGKTRKEVLGTDYYFNWDADAEVRVFYRNEVWSCKVYRCNNYSMFQGNQEISIDLGDKWN